MLLPLDALLLRGARARLCSRAEGRVLEVAIGTGLNLPYYPSGVQLVGVDQSPGMLARAHRRARRAGRRVKLLVGDAQHLDLPDGAFDTVVITLGLCTIPDPAAALREARRVLRPGGRLLLLEHVRSPVPLVRALQRALEPVARLWGDHLLRDPLDHLEGFSVERLERRALGLLELVEARRT